MKAGNETSSLAGEKLLILVEWELQSELLDRLRQNYPGLEVAIHRLAGYTSIANDLPEAMLKDVTILLTYRNFPAPEHAPKLKYVQLMSAGCNHIMENPLYTEREVAFCTANGVHPPQIAEWVIATFLAHQHHIPEYLDAMKDGNWITSQTDEDVEDAVNLRMGILGYGCIGRQCARLATALGMEVYAFTHRERSTPESRKDDSYIAKAGMGDPEGVLPSKWFSGTTPEAINEFISQDLDILVLAMPLTKLTHHMISAPQFELLSKKKTFISNIGRGPIVKTDDLVAALKAGKVRGAALDVTDPEPLPKDHVLWKMKNVIITPHTSGNSTHYNERVLGILEYNLKRLSEGQALVNQVDKELGY